MRSLAVVAAFLVIDVDAPKSSASKPQVTEVPEAVRERFDLDPFYRKYLETKGFPILSSEKVSDEALIEAADIVDHMLDGRDDVRRAMVWFEQAELERIEANYPRAEKLYRRTLGDDDRRAGAARHDAQGLLGPARSGPGWLQAQARGKLRRGEPAEPRWRSLSSREYPGPRIRPHDP